MPYGNLDLQIVEARNLRSTEVVGKNDPYCLLKIGTIKHKTKVISSGGANPVWNERFQLQIFEGMSSIQLTCLDQDPGKDDIIGLGVIDLENAFRTGVLDQWIPLRPEDSTMFVGEIHVVAYFRSSAPGPQMQAPPQNYNYAPAPTYPPQQYAQAMYQPQQAPVMYPVQQPVLQQMYPVAPPQGYPQQLQQPGYPAAAYPPQQPVYAAPYPPQQQGYAQYPPQAYPPQYQGQPGYPGYRQ